MRSEGAKILLATIRIRTWWMSLGLLIVAAVVALLFSRVDASIPLADGPRVLRQYLVVAIPCLASTVLLDHSPPLSPTFVRERLLSWLDRLIFVITIAVGLVLSWAASPLTLDSIKHDACIAMLLSAWLLAAVPRWGTTAIFAGTVAALVWLLAGDTIGMAMGFTQLEPISEPSTQPGEIVPFPRPPASRGWVSLGISAGIFVICLAFGRSRLDFVRSSRPARKDLSR